MDQYEYLEKHKKILDNEMATTKLRYLNKTSIKEKLSNLNIDSGNLIRILIKCFND